MIIMTPPGYLRPLDQEHGLTWPQNLLLPLRPRIIKEGCTLMTFIYYFMKKIRCETDLVFDKFKIGSGKRQQSPFWSKLELRWWNLVMKHFSSFSGMPCTESKSNIFIEDFLKCFSFLVSAKSTASSTRSTVTHGGLDGSPAVQKRRSLPPQNSQTSASPSNEEKQTSMRVRRA